jgi:hypothetical protein
MEGELERRAVRLVLACCSPYLTPPADLPPGTATADLVRAADGLGLRAVFAARVPASWGRRRPDLAQWARQARRAAAATTTLVDALRDTALAVARDAGVAAVVLKGALTGPVLYDRREARPSSDVDLQVTPRAAPRMHAVLLRHGFLRLERPGRTGSVSDAFEWPYRPPAGELLLDLHRGPCEPTYFQPDVEGWVARRRAYHTPRGALPGLCPEDLVVATALHAASHGFDLDLRGFLDLAWLTHRRGVDVGASVAQARALGAQVPMWLTLCILRDLLGWPEPGGVLEGLRPGWLRAVFLMGQVGWHRGRPHAYGSDNRARILRGIFPLLPGPGRAASFLGAYVRRRLGDLLGSAQP